MLMVAPPAAFSCVLQLLLGAFWPDLGGKRMLAPGARWCSLAQIAGAVLTPSTDPVHDAAARRAIQRAVLDRCGLVAMVRALAAGTFLIGQV